jgi:hypothetical protein
MPKGAPSHGIAPAAERLRRRLRAAAESSHAGPEGLASELAMKVATTFRRRMVAVAADLVADPPEVAVPLEIEVRRLTTNEIPLYRALRPDQSAGTAERRLLLGHHCFAIWRGGAIIHSAWTTTERAYVPYLRRDLLVDPRDLYIYDTFTAPAYRGLHLAPLRHLHLRRHYRQLGRSRALGLVAVENRSGLRVTRRLGFRFIGLFTCWRLGRWQFGSQESWADEPLPRLVEPA